jgi:hypothetical protein
MDEPAESIEARAQKYAEARGLTLGPQLGSGRDGIIWRANCQSRVSAIKVHERARSYARERDAYLRLREHNVEEICGLNVPVLLDHDDQLLALQMEVVAVPFVLDFASVYFDEPADFSDEVMADWEENGIELFGDGWPEVRRILARLTAWGIYYYDVSLGNIRLPE